MTTTTSLPISISILSEVTYRYTPTVGYIVAKAGVNLDDKTYTRPRLSTCVLLNPAASITCASLAPTLC